ncbi:PstS family phosphate ABC transporter substrate-binding protein [Winogradskya humida]|uniref:PstS family phosphate ABC transporter substrate-binding protein n=1 Tax=Winogradskya humida TaxID=113566 RepID=UPI001943C3D8|nr:substrate-binding domain-containing protein [Actinoplanes humidus]
MAAVFGDLFTELGRSLLSSSGLVFLVLGVVVPVVANVYIRNREKSRQRKKLLYNVLLNSRLGLDPPDAGDVVRLNDRNDKLIDNPSLAVVRITNDSDSDITEADYRAETRIQFPDGAVRTVDVTDAHPAELGELISEGIRIDRDAVILPSRHLNAGERFKLLILLSGGGGRAEDVKVTGLIRGGELVVAGSSAFATAAAQADGSYSTYCRSATVRVAPSNSQQGLLDLRDGIAAKSKEHRVAMADGLADPSVTAGMAERAIAIVAYTIVVNRKVFPGATGPVRLTTTQVRAIFGGRQRTWRDIDPRFAALPVKIVARGQSGSRNAFERYVLGDGTKPSSQGPRTSTNCVDQDYAGSDQTFLCEESSTGAVLDRASRLDGAIGYADAPDAARAGGTLLTVALDGRGSGLVDIGGGYPFWTVEHAYFRAGGDPLAVDFVDYLTGRTQEPALQNAGYPPCSANQQLCGSR